jgi:hypothetical protein
MTARNVLMCGGPADGRWVAVQDASRDWECVTVDADGTTTHRYSIVPIMIVSRKMYVGVVVDAAYLSNDDGAILRAVLQRDVAQYLGAYR